MLKPIAAALALAAAGTFVASGTAMAKGRRQAVAATSLPDGLRRAAIATRSDPHGEIAGARIPNTDIWVVYIKTVRGCGSGGCRAQIWTDEDGRFVQAGTAPVGRLPIVILPQTSTGMPLLGITVFDKQSGRQAIMPVAFDGRSYTQQTDQLLPANSGKRFLNQAMLRPF